MSTDCLFREDAYLKKECSATVVGLTDAGGIVLDRTVFYAASGGQPADRGVLTTATGDAILIEGASYTMPARPRSRICRPRPPAQGSSSASRCMR